MNGTALAAPRRSRTARLTLLGLALAAGATILALGPRPAWLTELASYAPDIVTLGQRHLLLVGVSVAFALATGVPLGILLSRRRFEGSAEAVMQALNVGATVPTLAVLALCMSVLGIGILPALFGLWLATLLPIVRNTYAGLRNVSPALLDAADGMGMTAAGRLRRVELPNAAPVLFAGIRTAVTVNIAAAPLASLIGAGGFGDLIFAGIQLYDPLMMLAGALATAGLALVADAVLAGVQRALTPGGRRRAG